MSYDFHDEFDTCGKCGGVTFGIKNRVRICADCYDELPLDPPSEDDDEDELECDDCGKTDDFGSTFTDDHDRLCVICGCGHITIVNDPAESGVPNSYFISKDPVQLQEDDLLRSRMEMMHDGDTDHEGGDLYSDRDNPEVPCPLCGEMDCDEWGDCDDGNK